MRSTRAGSPAILVLTPLFAGDPATIKSLLVSYSTEKPRPAGISEPCSIVEVGGTSTPLHLAVRCAKCEPRFGPFLGKRSLIDRTQTRLSSSSCSTAPNPSTPKTLEARLLSTSPPLSTGPTA